MTTGPSPTARLIVIGGYLGAGKTTLLNALLRDGRLGKTAVVVNDFGSVNIDADLIEAVEDDVMQLTNGCICCQISNAMIDTMASLARQNRFDTVLCEVSGVGQPDRMRTWGDFPGFRSGPVITVADTEAIPRLVRDQYVSDVVIAQLKSADAVLLSRGTALPEAICHKAAEVCTRFAVHAPVLEWTSGETLPDWFIHILVGQGSGNLKMSPKTSDYAHHVALEDRDVAHASVTVCLPTLYPGTQFFGTLASLAPALVRAKGHVRDLAGNIGTVQLANGQVTVAEMSRSPSEEERNTNFVLIASEPDAIPTLRRAVETISQALNVNVESLQARFST